MIFRVSAPDTLEIQHDRARNNLEAVPDIRGKNNIWINSCAYALVTIFINLLLLD